MHVVAEHDGCSLVIIGDERAMVTFDERATVARGYPTYSLVIDGQKWSRIFSEDVTRILDERGIDSSNFH